MNGTHETGKGRGECVRVLEDLKPFNEGEIFKLGRSDDEGSEATGESLLV